LIADQFVHQGQPKALLADLTEDALVLCRRRESQPVGGGRRCDPLHLVRDRLVDRDSSVPSERDRGCAGPHREEIVVRGKVLGEEKADARDVALELAVGGGSLLERPELAHPVVRLREDA
jgi:hypothetical protein